MGRLSVLFVLVVLLCAQPDDPRASPLPPWVRVEANIAYDNYPETVVDILRPGRSGLAKRPGAIVIHGDDWIGGSKESMVQEHCLRYLKEGFVVVNVEYRLAKSSPAPAAVTDVLEAAALFRRNADQFDVDPNRIVVTGTGAGGHLALMVGMTPASAELGPETKVAAVVSFYGATDVADLLSGPNKRDNAVTWLPEQDDRLELARRLSPLTYARKDLPPVLTIHGDADEVVPYDHSVRLTQALKKAKATAELITVKGGKHGRFGEKKLDKIYRDIFKFLRKRRVIR